MSRPRPSLSLDLPPCEFEPLSQHATLPKTPEPMDEPQSALDPPPPPRPQTFKLKRRRIPVVPQEDVPLSLFEECAIPTIEMSEAASEFSSPTMQPMQSSDGLLTLPDIQRLITPQTPAPRDLTDPANPVNEWSLITDSRNSKRPAFERSRSVCSSFSDSSVSSCGSSAFSVPNNGSCTSPESVGADPFTGNDLPRSDKFLLSPAEKSSTPNAKRHKRHRHARWTPEMIKHLEKTYTMYIRDPIVTPFKTLPGAPPPLGVCQRVASNAKHSWSYYRSLPPSSLDKLFASAQSLREGSPDTIRPGPLGDKIAKQPAWPSHAATRRQLRKIVRSKPELGVYYQRLLQYRSPSPFTSSSAAGRSSDPPSATATVFSGNDMKISLITATAPSMQPHGPLAQLASEDTTREEEENTTTNRSSRPSDWFARIGRSQAHQKSASLQSELNVNIEVPQPSCSLASPFDEATNRSHLLHSMSTTKSLGRTAFNGKAGGVRSLDSPIVLTGAPTAPRSLKRRFKSDEEKPRRPGMFDVFGPPSEDAGIVRNRGFTVGAARATDNLAKLSEQPTAQTPDTGDHVMTEAPPFPDNFNLGPIGSHSAPRRLIEPVPRLGSPFMGTQGAGRSFNTFPRSYIPTADEPAPFARRLRELAQQRHS